MSLLRLSSLRHFVRHPLQAVFAVLGIALGVAVVVSIDLAIGSSRRAFDLSADAVFGRSTHQVLAGPGGLPDSAYVRIVAGSGVAAAPVVEAWSRIRSGERVRTLRLLGVDPFAEAPFRSYADTGPDALDAASLLTRPGAILIAAGAAAELDVATGDSVRVEIGGHHRDAWIAGVLHPTDPVSGSALSDIALADIATAQELAGRVGRIDRIDVRIREAGDEARLALVRQLMPPGAQLIASGARAEATSSMTRAFELNLTAFALIALIFGALLIYDTMTFSIVQRRELIGLLRAVGVTRREISMLVFGEALMIGVVATLLGIALGALLGSSLVRLVARTINDLYFQVSVTGVALSPRSIVKGLLLGIGATVAATIAPLREATSTAPRLVLSRSVLEARTRRGMRRAAVAGLIAFGIAFFLVLLPGRAIVVGFAALFAVVAGGALLAPFGATQIMRLVRPLAMRSFGSLGGIAVRGVPAALSRTGPAIAALMVAVSVGAAVGIMVGSFRHSVVRWLDATLQADLYIASPTAGTRGEGTLDAAVIAGVGAIPGVAGYSTLRQALVPFHDRDLRVVAVDMYPRHRDLFTFVDRAGDPWPAFAGGSILVSESFAWRNAVGPGDTVRLATVRGETSFPVAGVFRDYASEFGVVFIDRHVYDTYWDDAGVSSLAVFLAPGASADAVASVVRERAGGRDVFVRSNRGLRDSTLEVFDRTFVITGVLRALALIVAFVGVLSALMALQLERGRELGVLRATGVTPGQLHVLLTAQTGLIGLAAGLLAVPLSLALAWLLIHVVNRRSFGWTIEMQPDLPGLAAAVALAVIAALLAGLYPAHRMSRTPPAIMLREE